MTQVLLRDFQMHAYKPQVQHVDFQRVDATTKITKKVPLHFRARPSPAVKTDKCTVNHVVTELEITCLAQQPPEFIEVDLSGLTRVTRCTSTTSSCPPASRSSRTASPTPSSSLGRAGG